VSCTSLKRPTSGVALSRSVLVGVPDALGMWRRSPVSPAAGDALLEDRVERPLGAGACDDEGGDALDHVGHGDVAGALSTAGPPVEKRSSTDMGAPQPNEPRDLNPCKSLTEGACVP
jgi:hypothetical protein